MKSAASLFTDHVPAEHIPARQPRFVRLGYVAGAHGLNGALRIRTDNPHCNSFAHLRRLCLSQESAPLEYRIVRAQAVSPRAIKVVLDGVSTVDAACALRGAPVMVAVADLPALKPGEFYYFQALGCEVVTTRGQRLGVIEEIFSTGANDVLVVRGAGREHLIPVIDDLLKAADWSVRRLTVEAVPGLLD